MGSIIPLRLWEEYRVTECAGMGFGKDRKNSEVLSDFFALVFTGKICLQESRVTKTSGKVWSKKNVPLVEEDQYLNKLEKTQVDQT